MLVISRDAYYGLNADNEARLDIKAGLDIKAACVNESCNRVRKICVVALPYILTDLDATELLNKIGFYDPPR